MNRQRFQIISVGEQGKSRKLRKGLLNLVHPGYDVGVTIRFGQKLLLSNFKKNKTTDTPKIVNILINVSTRFQLLSGMMMTET
jgi:hypothetical protein